MRTLLFAVFLTSGLLVFSTPPKGRLEISSKKRYKVITVESGDIIKVGTAENRVKGEFQFLNDSMFTVDQIPFHINEIESIYVRRFRPLGTGLLVSGGFFVAIGVSIALLPDHDIEGCNQVVGLFVGCIGMVGVIPGALITGSRKKHPSEKWEFSLKSF
jgi:hypothetical protein